MESLFSGEGHLRVNIEQQSPRIDPWVTPCFNISHLEKKF